MAVYTWPTPTAGNKAFWPRSVRWRVIYNDRSTVSALSGYTQTGSNPGARLACSIDIDRQSYAERQQLAAFIDRLEGNKHRVALHDLANPLPRGSIGTSGVTLSATAAQFATSVALAGCRGTNALLGGSFETDANADGVCDGWLRYSSGSFSGLTASRSTGGTHATYTQLTSASTLGGTAADQQGVYQQAVPVAHLAGLPAIASVQAYGSGGQGCVLVEWLDAGSAVISSVTASAALTGVWAAISAGGTVPANAVRANVYLYQHSAGGGPHFVYWDEAQLRAGASVQPYAAPASLLAGDWLGLATGQLVRAVVDATATDAGAMTVEVRQPLRVAASSASAVTLARPTTQMVLQLSGGESPAVPFDGNGLAPAFTLDFVEAWA